MPNANAVILGPGTLFAAPTGTAEPSDATTALPGAWRNLGYTDDGSVFNYEIKSDPIWVEEEYDPVRYVTSQRNGQLTFNLSEITRANLAMALNMGANLANDDTSLEPPAANTEVRVMLAFNTDQGARWLFRQALQTGSISIRRKKAPEKSLIPVAFRLEKPTSLSLFKIFPTAAGLV